MSEAPVGAVLSGAAARLVRAGVPSPEADARLLLAHAWDCEPRDLGMHALRGTAVPAEVAARLDSALAARARRVPLQHIVGTAPFRHLDLSVGPGVFIPRPETELLVDAVLRAVSGNPAPRVLDLCTGSGALALAIATEAPGSEVVAVEKDEQALRWARTNLTALGGALAAAGSRCTLVAADVRDLPALGRFDVVVSNPPYVPADRMHADPEVARHDPEVALYGGGDDGMDLPAVVIAVAAQVLRPGGALVLEHDETQGAAVRAAMAAHGLGAARTCPDYTGRDRYSTAARPEES